MLSSFTRKIGIVAISLMALELAHAAAHAQLGLPDLDPFNGQGALNNGLANLDPTNPNGTVNQALQNLDQARLNQMSPSPRAGRDFTRLHIKNSTNRVLHAAVRFIPYSDPNNSQLSGMVGSGGFQTRAWFTLQPGQDVYIGNTANDIFYTYAQDDFGGQWAGNDFQWVRDGNRNRSIGFRQHYYLRVGDYTMEFR